MIQIDGSYWEGGGQILRTASALSTITKIPIHIYNIRKGREKAGLKTQHLLGLRALSELCGGTLEGDFLESQEIKFFPGSTWREQISINIPTAGSISLLLQGLLLAALFSERTTKILFKGGATDTFFSPAFDYFRFVFLQALKKLTSDEVADVTILRRGYYPSGGAEVEVKVRPLGYLGKTSKLKRVNLTKRGTLEKIIAISGASESLRQRRVAERQLAGVREIFAKLKLPLEEKAEYYDTASPGSQICLIARFENTVLGVDNLGKLGKRAEDVGKEAALELLKEERSGACLDKHMTDQYLPYIALTPGKSQVSVSEITNHCKTNIWVIEKFLEGKFEIEGSLISWNSK